MMNSLRCACVALACGVLLSGCESNLEKALCPTSAILANASSLTEFKPGLENDPAGALFTLHIDKLEQNCSLDLDEGTLTLSLDIGFRATRNPTGEPVHRRAPYFVSEVVDGTTILDKQIKGVVFDFSPGATSVEFTEHVDAPVIHMANGKRPFDYSALVGLQLTREQMNYNQKTGQIGQ